MSTVRPLIDSEERHGYGEPLACYTGFFGFTFGVMSHLKMYGITASDPWFPNRQAKATGMVLLGGGLIGGYYFGRFIFGDAALRRLSEQHRMDRRNGI